MRHTAAPVSSSRPPVPTVLEDPACAVCGEKCWSSLATRTYSKADTPGDDYNRVRHEVLFELWFPGSDEVSLESILCDRCGFLCYRPRPEGVDIDEKYAFIARHEQASKEFTVEKASDKPRSWELFKHLEKKLSRGANTILDYGGGNGRLLRYFLERGHDCSTLELVDETLPGIRYAGAQISDLSALPAFDVVICSHVLEHLADPLATLRQLIPHVKDDGLVYIEVPAEIWHRPPPAIDPVTHINFFTTDSIRVLMEESGLAVESCRYQTFTRPIGLQGLAIKAVGRVTKGERGKPVEYPGNALVHTLLNPGLFDRVKRLLSHPRLLTNLLH